MPSSKTYADFILDQLGELKSISSRKMMGEYILYYEGKVFGGIYDDRFLVKITKASKELMPGCKEEIPYPSAKPMLLVEEVENKDFLAHLVIEMCKELTLPKKKKKLER